MAQTHPETGRTTLGRVWSYLVWLSARRFYGEVRVKFRDGAIVGHVHEDRDLLAEGLPQASPEEVERALKSEAPAM